MFVKDHYLTCAAFFVKDHGHGSNEVLVDCSVGGNSDRKAVIRKLCVCGSPVMFDENQMAWSCSDSGTDLEIPSWNFEPLVTPEATQRNLGPNMSDLRHPERESVIAIDETGHLQLFIKVPKDHLWVISDPLTVADSLQIKPIQTDLLVSWSLLIGDDFTGGLGSVEILLNIADPRDERILEHLASRSMVVLHFLDAESLSAIGNKRLKPRPETSNTMNEVRYRVLRLPKEPREREAALQKLAEAQQISAMSDADKLGMCTWLDSWLGIPQSDSMSIGARQLMLEEHVKVCEVCQRMGL